MDSVPESSSDNLLVIDKAVFFARMRAELDRLVAAGEMNEADKETLVRHQEVILLESALPRQAPDALAAFRKVLEKHGPLYERLAR
jgi:hypothetical protein